MAEKRSFKDRLQGAVDSAKNAIKDVDLSSVKDKIQETAESAVEAAKKVKLPEKKEQPEYKHNIVQLKGSSIVILLPEGYVKLKHKNPLRGVINSVTNEETAYGKAVEYSNNVAVITKCNLKDAMDPDDLKGHIYAIRGVLSDSQGIIEADNGETKRGYKYIYSIVKSLSESEFGGVRYSLLLDLLNGSDAVSVRANFDEIGTTGLRETLCVDLARRAGLTEITSAGLKNWAEDPYDPEFKKGALKNLAEKEGLDVLFPENPLSQAHEFLLAALKDEYVIVNQNNEAEEAVSEREGLNEEEKETLLNLFVDKCRRDTYLVDVLELKEEGENAQQGVSKPDQSDADYKAARPLNIQAISTRNAIKIFYYVMAADGQIFHNEEDKFNLIANEIDPNFADNKEKIILECKAQLDKVIDPEDYYDVLQEGVEDALTSSKTTADTFITPKLLVWDLLTLAYSDEQYDETERKLIKYIVRKTNVDKTVFLEMESSIMTLMDIENELSWIKTTNKPYLTIEAMVNELVDRRNVIFESVKDLIAL